MWYTYILISVKDLNFYIGCTKDLKERFSQHENGECLSTKHRRPLKLVYYEACLSKHDMRAREKYLKSGMGHRYLKNRLQDYLKNS